jgi:hypothetical protein
MAPPRFRHSTLGRASDKLDAGMTVRPPAPQHFSGAPPSPAPPSRKNVVAGAVAMLVAAAALADAFCANRRTAHAIERADHAEASQHAGDAERRAELANAAAQVAALKARMRKLEAKAGVVGSAREHAGSNDAGRDSVQ